MAWDKITVYDGTPLTNATVTFARDEITVDDDGNTVAVDERRFTKEPVGICGNVEWGSTGVNLGDQDDAAIAGESGGAQFDWVGDRTPLPNSG